ncbi:hypothetical protein LSAT2_021137 [Lamellibrachia satsuma]|nr:hypothetical protein LSAT2_021137 [Lamellibrachia satsuma]
MTGICLPIFSFLLTLVWFSGTTTGFFSNGYNLFFNQAAKITPADAYVVVGDELVLNCTLTQFFTKNLNASFMYFGRMSDSGQPAKIPDRLQHVLGPRILQLRIPGMKKTNADTYSCYINETSVGGSATAMPAVPATVQVDFRPDPVTSVTCISDNFESMTCSWCPEVMPSTLTKWTLDWRIGSASAWSTCTIPFNAKGQRRCSCTWLSTGLDSQPLISAGAFKPFSVYELRVTTKSRFLAQPFRAESKSGNHSGYFNAKQCSYDFCGVPCPNGGATTFMRYLPYQMNFTVQDLFGTVHSTVTVRTMPRIGIVHWVL